MAHQTLSLPVACQSLLEDCGGPEHYARADLGISNATDKTWHDAIRCYLSYSKFCNKEHTKEVWFTSEWSTALPLGTGGFNFLVTKMWSSLVPRTVPNTFSAQYYKTKVTSSLLFGKRTLKNQRNRRQEFAEGVQYLTSTWKELKSFWDSLIKQLPEQIFTSTQKLPEMG